MRDRLSRAAYPLALASAIGLAACGGGSSPKPSGHTSGHQGGTAVVLAPANPGTADPALNTGTLWAQLIDTNDGLVAFNKVGGMQGTKIVADLATAVPAPSDGGRTYAFHVRPGIRYSNGTMLKASDFTNVFDRMFKVNGPTTSTFYSGIVGAAQCLKHASTCDLSKGIVADDAAGTVAFHLSQPDPEFLDKLALPYAFAVPPSAPNKDVGTSPLPGTGPYEFVQYTPNQQMRLVRNPYFKPWSVAAQPPGYPNQMLIKFGLSLEADVTQVENNQADGILSTTGLPTDRLNEISTRFASQTHVDPVPAIFYMALNTRVAPFNDVHVRQALNYATDRNAAVKVVGGPRLAVPSCQILPPNFPGYQPYCPYTANPAVGGRGAWTGPDVAKAKQLISASHTQGMKVTIVNPNVPLGQATGLYFVSLLNQLGYKATLKQLAPAVQDPLVKNSRNKVQMSFQVWYLDYPAASDFLNVLMGCGSFHPNSDANQNVAEFCDSKIQSDMNRALAAQLTNPNAADQLWAQVDREVTDQAPEIVMFNPKVVNFVSHRVGNFVANPQWQWLIDQSWVQ